MTKGSQLGKHGAGTGTNVQDTCILKFILRGKCMRAKGNVTGRWQIRNWSGTIVLVSFMISTHDFILPVTAGEENKATLLELGAVEPLTKLLTHEDKIVRRNATMIFGILASNSKCQLLKSSK